MKSLNVLIGLALLFMVACAPVVTVNKMGNEYIQDAHSRNWWGPNWQRVTYCWKLHDGYCPKDDTRVETANQIGMESPGQKLAIAAITSVPLSLGIGLGLANSGSRISQSVGGLNINEHFSTKYIGK